MELREAIDRVLLGEPLRSIAVAHREAVLRSLGMQSDEVSPRELWDDTGRFMNRLCRELGERHGGDRRAGVALADWAQRVEEYDVYDALLANFDSFEGREHFVQRGRQLFPGPLTAHWESGD
ncbi:MAG: hypothetical protein O2865_02315 [Planctomycetota bacterium]|nr:hypothetical protein [Planctomycetota bacterium]MDA0933558.1 hypothetical protein [Planctomycetota bacterium]MDA1220753.1 hypothetical protein [Planctomycetota bacterium]